MNNFERASDFEKIFLGTKKPPRPSELERSGAWRLPKKLPGDYALFTAKRAAVNRARDAAAAGVFVTLLGALLRLAGVGRGGFAVRLAAVAVGICEGQCGREGKTEAQCQNFIFHRRKSLSC